MTERLLVVTLDNERYNREPSLWDRTLACIAGRWEVESVREVPARPAHEVLAAGPTWTEVVQAVGEQLAEYPADVFMPGGESQEARAADFARGILDAVIDRARELARERGEA